MINDPSWWMEVAAWLAIEVLAGALFGEFVVRPVVLQVRRDRQRRRRR